MVNKLCQILTLFLKSFQFYIFIINQNKYIALAYDLMLQVMKIYLNIYQHKNAQDKSCALNENQLFFCFVTSFNRLHCWE